MNHFYDTFQRKRKSIPSNEGKESMKKPKLVSTNQADRSDLKAEYLNSSIEYQKPSSKNFFQAYYNSHRNKDEDKIMIDSSINSSSKPSLYEKYVREMGNYQYLLGRSQGMNITPCCKK